MAVRWQFKSFIANKHGIYGAVDLQKLIVKKTGILISLQNVCNYFEKKPKMLRITTIEIICTALECSLSDFFQIAPNEKIKKSDQIKKLSFQNTPHSKRSIKRFPDPDQYKSQS